MTNVILSVRGCQSYMDQEPEEIELVTEGTLKKTGESWELQYEESPLTGLEGVTTTFEVLPGKVILTRTGKLNSQMIFVEGVRHDSLYQMDFGALMISVCATAIRVSINEGGGTIDLEYDIEVEQSAAGKISYHLDIRKK